MVKRLGAIAAAPADEDTVLELPAEAAAAEDVVREDDAPADGLPKRAARNADGTVSLPLRYPVTLKVQRGGETIREEVFASVKLHRMTGADVKVISAATGEAGLSVAFARSTRLNPAIATRLFDRLDAADAADASTVVAFFCGAGERTGR